MNILVIRFSALGDLITYEPAFRAIRFFFSSAHITFLTSSTGAGLYSDTDHFDQIVIHESFFQTRMKLTRKFDFIFNLQGNRLSHILSAVVSSAKKINISQSAVQRFLGIKKPPKKYSQLLSDAGISSEVQKPYWLQQKSSQIILRSSFPFNRIEKTKNVLVGLAIGASPRWNSKKWGKENFLELTEMLLAKDFQVLLVGGETEMEDAAYIQKNSSSIDNLVAKTNLTELKAVMTMLDVFVGNDSGPAHMAAAVGCSTVTIFGSTSVRHCVKNLPYVGRHVCIEPSKSVECHPCYKAECIYAQHKCMNSISVEKVYQQIIGVLS